MINNKESNFVSIVAYIRNNEKDIELFIEEIQKQAENNFNKYEIIFVNDASTDNSIAKAKAFCKDMQCVVSFVEMSFFQGIEKSLAAGTDLAIGDYVFEFETIILDYDLNIFMQAYAEMIKGHDIVNVSPKKCGRKQLFYTLYNLNKFSTKKITSTRFRLLSRRAINRVSSQNNKIPYRKAAFAECGLSSTTIFFEPIKKINNHNKEDRNMINGTAYESLLIFTDAILKVASIITALFLIAALGLGITIIVQACLANIIAEALYFSLIICLSFGLTNMSLCFIIRYMSIIIYTQYKKKEYVIESVEKLNKNM